jgi:hypothetical protein
MASLMGRSAKIVTSSGTVAEMYEWTIDIDNELIEEAVFGNDGWNRVHGSSVKAYGGTMSGLLDITDTDGQTYLYNAMVSGTALTDVYFHVDATNYYAPDTASSATASLYIGNYSVTAATTDVIRLEITFRGNGPLILTS